MRVLIILFSSLLVALVQVRLVCANVYRGPFAPLDKDGRVIETDEVASARAAHLSAYAKALTRIESIRSRIAKSPEVVTEMPQVDESNGEEDNGSYGGEEEETTPEEAMEFEEIPPPSPPEPQQLAAPLIYKGPFAELGDDGRVIETQEVAKARAAHMAAHAKVMARITGAPQEVEDIYPRRSKNLIYEYVAPPLQISYTVGYHSPGLAPVDSVSGRVRDTPEVEWAKAAHLKEHAKRATLLAKYRSRSTRFH